MEGPLSKWTNVVHGWQYRWFVLSEDALFYFTSKEKMLKGQQRGCLRLRGAVVGIDGENKTLFTITVDGKTFHLQGRDEKERNDWVRALETAIRASSAYHHPQHAPVALRAQVTQANLYLETLTEQIPKLHAVKGEVSEADRQTVEDILLSGNRLMETIGKAVVLLQMAQSRIECKALMTEGTATAEPQPAVDQIVAPISYSSSDEEFYDAEGEGDEVDKMDGNQSEKKDATEGDEDEGEDFDAVYDVGEESDVGDVQQQHGSVIVHLLSQVSVGMDLTKVTLPTFILERRSLLEMYADFFAHPDTFIVTPTLPTPEQRFIAVVRYYLSAFYAARKSGVAKKPYNPILGETFRCRYSVPGMAASGVKTTSGPFPGSDTNELTFIAEQVSHHPPVSAFYAEHPNRRISFHAHIYTKSSFLGMSIGVANIGSGRVILHDLGEEYEMTFPSGYGRSILSTPWVELGGKVKVTCEKTGYYADIEFLTKPFFGGRKHRIAGSVFKEGNKNAILTIRGEWNNVLYAKGTDGIEYVMCDVRKESESKKQCTPVMQQGERESRRLWRHVTVGLLRNKIARATAAKREIEQRQRQEAKERTEKGETWNSSLFSFQQNKWLYNSALIRNPI